MGTTMGIARCLIFLPGLACGTLPLVAVGQTGPIDLKFAFTSGPGSSGYTQVSPLAMYADRPGYGYEPSVPRGAGSGPGTSGDQPVLFSVKVPEGNYDVTVTLSGGASATTVTVKAESGRLMLERVRIAAGQVIERTFTTNVRTPALGKLPTNATGREEVTLDQFDRGNVYDWDDKLTVEIIAPHSALQSMEIRSAPNAPTIFLAGDSTVTDRDGGNDVSWGQLLPRFLKPGVAVSNQAQSGETLKSFASALRLDKILSQMKKGDYLFIQFAHNDSKASWPQTYVEPETTYKAYLKVYIAEARRRGATPVLVTAMDRGARGTGAPQHGHGGYPEAMREVAREENVALIDLYNMSIALYEAAGADAPLLLADGTHSTAYGGYELAKCIAMGIRRNKLDLARFIVDDFGGFDPLHLDTQTSLNLGPLFHSPTPARGAGAPGLLPSVPPPAANTPPGPGPL